MKGIKKFYILSLLISLSVFAPRVWAQPPDLPEGRVRHAGSGAVREPRPDAAQMERRHGAMARRGVQLGSNYSFGDCDTDSCDSANSYAQYVCAANGYDVGIWTGRKAAGCGPGGPGGPVTNGTGNFSFYCLDDSIPCDPFLEDSCVPSDQTQIEVFCCNISRPALSPIPAISEWGLIATAAALGVVGFMVFKRRKQTA